MNFCAPNAGTHFITTIASKIIAGDMGSVISLFIMLAVLIASIAFIVSKLIPSDRKIHLFYEDILRNAFISIIVIAILPGIFWFFCSASNTILIQSSSNVDFVAEADAKMAELENQLIGLIKQYRDQAINEYSSDSSRYLTIPGIGIGSVYLPYKDTPKAKLYLSRANTAIGAMNMLLSMIAVQRFVFAALTSSPDLFAQILVFAVLLRIFPFFREAGDFIFAMAVALVLLMPFLYYLFTVPFSQTDFAADICRDITTNPTLFQGLSFNFLKPMTCQDVAMLGVLNVYAMFLPNVVYGLTFVFASNFKKIFDIFDWGG